MVIFLFFVFLKSIRIITGNSQNNMNDKVEQLTQEFSQMSMPSISKEEYISMRQSGMLHSEMASYDLMPPVWANTKMHKQQGGAVYARDARQRGVYQIKFDFN